MKTFIANETLLLIDGEVMITETFCKKGDTLIDTNSNTIYKANTDSDCLVKYIYKIVASTKQLPNVKQLPREVFVKDVDVEKLAWDKYSPLDPCANAFVDGYNSNNREFTKKELDEAIDIAFSTGRYFESEYNSVEKVIYNKINPITLPKSITTNDELEIIKIEW